MATAIEPEKISRDLRQLWAQLAQDQAQTGGVLKACATTLIVLAEKDGDAEQVRQTLGVLMHDHPSRAIVIGAAKRELEANVFAECWKPFGQSQQICSEGIEISPGAAGLDEVARFVVPLRVPDLPVVLWCRGPLDQTYMYRKRYQPLYALADKIIFDSKSVLDAEASIEFLRSLRAPARHIADLHWTRLTGWREVISHIFDDGATDPTAVRAVNVGYGGGSASTCALYFAAWIRTSLPKAAVTLEPIEGAAGIRSVSMQGASETLRVALTDGCVQVEGWGRSYRTALPSLPEESLMRRELRILGADPVWDKVISA